MSELDKILKSVCESLKETSSSVENLKTNYEASNVPINDKVSLLSLKNASMLAYINTLMVVIGEKLGGDFPAETGREKSIEHRVVLERGVRPLEKKLSYQLDKLARAHTRIQKEYAQAEKKAAAQEEYSDSSDDEMAQRPRAFGGKPEEEDTKETAVYHPPKINSTLSTEDKFNVQSHKDRSNKLRMQAMDEYLREQSDRPDWESSIGANILDHGRSGVKSLRDSERDRKVTEYEEENFTRLRSASKADKRKDKRRERAKQTSIIGGEDFSIFGSKRKLEESTTRGSKKSRNAWERAKKRM